VSWRAAVFGTGVRREPQVAPGRTDTAPTTDTEPAPPPPFVQAERSHTLARRALRRIRRQLFNRRMALVTVSWIVGFGVWEVAAQFSSEYAFAGPLDTFSALRELASSGVLWEHTEISSRELGIAFALGSTVGIVGGTIAGMSRTFKTLTEQWITVGLALPFAAIFPILLVWFGLGETSKVALGAFAAVMPVWGNTRVGIESVDPQLLEMTRSFGGRRRHLVRMVVLPWALPSIIEGLRFGLTRAFLGVIIGEMLASRGGLGYLINVSGETLQIDNLLAAVVVVTTITLVIVWMMTLLRRVLVPWWDRNGS
jgi:ABC-type nitrate/sulfonate/bicarbonate transport system permease component